MIIVKEFTVRMLQYPTGRYKLIFPAEFQWKPVFFKPKAILDSWKGAYLWRISNYLFFQRKR